MRSELLYIWDVPPTDQGEGSYSSGQKAARAVGTTGAENITSHDVNMMREYDVKKLRSPACSRLDNANFSPRIHATNGK